VERQLKQQMTQVRASQTMQTCHLNRCEAASLITNTYTPTPDLRLPCRMCHSLTHSSLLRCSRSSARRQHCSRSSRSASGTLCDSDRRCRQPNRRRCRRENRRGRAL
jgi:hypothetical protein